MKKIIIALSFVVHSFALGCSCENVSPFSELVKAEGTTVVKAKIVSYYDYTEGRLNVSDDLSKVILQDPSLTEGLIKSNEPVAKSMIAVVEFVYQGNLKEKVIKIWGDNGYECRPYVSAFTKGKEYILILHRLPSDEESETGIPEYNISICGEYWLKEESECFIGDNSSESYEPSVFTETELKQLFSNKTGNLTAEAVPHP